MTTIASSPALGRAVRAERERRGLTQRQLADRAGVGRQWLVGFELGDKHSAPLDMIFRVLQALDLTVTLAPPPTPPPVPEVDLATVLARHSGPDR